MKKHTLIIIILFFSINVLKAQKKTKDTLFFSIDKYYTILPTISPNISNRTYKEQIESEREQIKHTKTNGYVYFDSNQPIIKGLKPKKIVSIKDYIENRKFYFDGIYNEIIDEKKLEKLLINKYKIFFVNGNEFIESSILGYTPYYPTRDKDWNVIKSKAKRDTLFFKLDNFLYQSKYDPKEYIIKDNYDSREGANYFKELKIINNAKPKNILSFKKYAKALDMYMNNTKKIFLVDLSNLTMNYVVILVNKNYKKTEYVEVGASFVIE